MRPTVTVLLSTYNGEKYLRGQIDSIFMQQDVEVFLLVRDDGSSDDTKEILAAYGDRIRFVEGKNVGVGPSFMELVYRAGLLTDYYAFCDQDDIWLPQKLSAAIEMLRTHDKAALYCSNQTLINAAGEQISLRHKTNPDTSLLQIICDNRISGCTMVWNSNLQNLLIREPSRPSMDLLKKRIHDVWVGAVAAATGEIIYDSNSYIQYRQHDNNVVGVRKTSRLKQWKKKLRDPSLRNGRSALAKEIYLGYRHEVIQKVDMNRLEYCGFYLKDREKRKQLLKDWDIPKHTGESRVAFVFKVLRGLF